ncbi:MAG TPA: glucose-6-phosphate isomerase [Candidatus Methylomirabilis sp.]|nr:glucose-6-phosphate isomerase [Candidatus Methylomirabilis sp.]
MTRLSLRYDDTNMRSAAVGKTGVSPREWSAMLPRLRAARNAVQKLARMKEQGFMDLPFERKTNAVCTKLAKQLSRSFTDLVVLGIGGSDLGARALQQALAPVDEHKKGTMRLHFAGSSTDPDELSRLLKRLNMKKTCVNVISKSGDTLETMAAFLVFRDRILKSVGPGRMPSHIVATTDEESGSLNELARKERYELLPVPMNVGGRFSVLSSVGLFPAAAIGIDTTLLLQGAKSFVEGFHECTPNECMSTRYAGLHVIGMERRDQRIHVTMPYATRLAWFAHWVRQLVAESLGKQTSRKGKTIHAGPTPVNAVGPEDQHSQMQLYNEGPFDKLITFIEVKRFNGDIRTPAAGTMGNAIARFGSRSFQDLIHLERRATAESLCRNMRPNATLTMDRIDARAMGELIMFWEIAVALMGELTDVNAYNQPGVELSKRIMREAFT